MPKNIPDLSDTVEFLLPEIRDDLDECRQRHSCLTELETWLVVLRAEPELAPGMIANALLSVRNAGIYTLERVTELEAEEAYDANNCHLCGGAGGAVGAECPLCGGSGRRPRLNQLPIQD